MTSASKDDYDLLRGLLYSISEWEPTRNVVVYDLGMTNAQISEITKLKVRLKESEQEEGLSERFY